uniref:TNF_2 domain-containing protein n=1 Tax=Macrostomum lignano TaxID=282301 RepID=A0A1I8HE44_9PLAT
MHFVLDKQKLKTCARSGLRVKYTDLPCMRSDTEYYTIDGCLGPVVCRDECQSDSSRTVGCRCHDNAGGFNLTGNSGSVGLNMGGVYLIYAQVSFRDSESSPVAVSLQVNGKHTSAQCHQANSMSNGSYCVINSQRRFKVGDRVAVHSPEAFRVVNADSAVTFWGLVRLSD